MEPFTVTHLGVPIGRVELPEGREWAGGWLDEFAAVASIRPVLAPVARRVFAELLIASERDAALIATHVPPELREAFARAETLAFELVDARGLKVPRALVRIADSGAERLHVRAYFSRANAPVPATKGHPLRSDDDVGPRSA